MPTPAIPSDRTHSHREDRRFNWEVIRDELAVRPGGLSYSEAMDEFGWSYSAVAKAISNLKRWTIGRPVVVSADRHGRGGIVRFRLIPRRG